VSVPGRTEGDAIEIEPVFVRRGADLVRGSGMPPRQQGFEQAGIDLAELLHEDG
jgi:pilus assembly protein CpaF